jgi:ABC-type transporter lipoprotein component MlaA
MPSGILMVGLWGLGYFTRYAQGIAAIEQMERMTIDPYHGMKAAWEQNRAKRVDETRERIGRAPKSRPGAQTALDLFDEWDDDD